MFKISVIQLHIPLLSGKFNDMSSLEPGLILYILLLLNIAVGFFLLSCHLLHSNDEIGYRCILRELLTCCFTLVCLFRRFSTTGRFKNKEEGCVQKWMSTTQKLALPGKNDFELLTFHADLPVWKDKFW